MKRRGLKSMERLFLSMLLVILIPFFSSLFLFQQTLTIVTDKTNDYTRAMLEQIKTVLDGKRNNLASTVYDLSVDPQFISFVYAGLPLENSRYYSIWDIQSILKRYAAPDDFLMELGIYFSRSDTIVTTSEVRRLSEYYNTYFAAEIPSFEEFGSRLSQTGANGIFLDPISMQLPGGTRWVLPYICRFSSNNSGMNDGYVFFFINLNTMEKLLSKVDVFSYGNIYLTHGNDVLWAKTGNPDIASEIEVGESLYSFHKKDDTIIAYLTSKEWGWTYYLEVSSKGLLDQWDSIRSILYPLLMILFLELIVGAIISYMTSKPLIKMTDTISKTMDTPLGTRRVDEMKFLESFVNRMIADNATLENALRTHYPILKMEFINNLYRGEYTSRQEIGDAMQAMGISLEGEVFLVLLAVVAEHGDSLATSNSSLISEQSNGRILLMETAEDMGREMGILASLYEKNKVVILFPSRQNDREAFQQGAQEFAASIKRTMLQEYGVFVSLFGGNICDGLENIPASFSEARLAYEFFWDSEESRVVHWASTVPEKGYVHSYSIETQERLVQLVSAGREEEALQILEEIFQAHFVHTKLPLAERAQLLIEIRGTLLKLYERFKLDYSMFHIYMEDCNKGNEETFRYMVGYFSSLCKMSCFIKNDKATRLKGFMLEFVHENYRNPDLSLAMICERFSIGEATLSQFFKNAVGDNLSQYVENLRITEACRLLSDSRNAVADIALEVGYTSDKSFRRAFKRLKAVSPTEFRRNLPVSEPG